jgi:hypothetical protein
MAALGIGLIFYVVIIILAIVFLVWFIRTLNEIKHSLLRIEMKVMGYDPVAREPYVGVGGGAGGGGGGVSGGDAGADAGRYGPG